MKYLYFLLLLALIALHSAAQLNYSFSADTAPYQSIKAGLTPVLVNRPFAHTTNYPYSPEYSFDYDEGFANGIPIGFTFNYNGQNYTTININANGFATLGAPLITDSSFYETYYINNLTNGNVFGQLGATATLPSPGYPYFKNKPFLAPLWDDLDLGLADGNFHYKTTGVPGNEVFTVEWSNIYWQYDATSPELSVELKLYESTNIIEFCYKDLGGTPSPEASASIGITDNYNNGVIMSLQDVSANPVVSSVENSNINQKPANNQVYRFTPLPYPAPQMLQYSAYTDKQVNFTWQAVAGASAYQYAVTTTAGNPAGGTQTPSTTGSVSSLTAATSYYIHVRAVFAGGNFSDWSTIWFQSAAPPATLPFRDGFESYSPPQLPPNGRLQVADSLNFSPGLGTNYPLDAVPAATYNDGYADDGSNYLQLNANLDTVPAAFYLQGLNLSAGGRYKIHFHFAPGFWNPANDAMDTGINHLDVLTLTAGTAVGIDSASQTIVRLPYRSLDLSKEDAQGYIDTTVYFTPSRTAVYYVGFMFESGMQVDEKYHSQTNTGYASLDDISISGLTLPVTLLDFTGQVQGKVNTLEWITATEQNNTGFEVQRSADGIAFSKIGFVNTKALNGNSAVKLTYNYTDASFTPGTNYYRLKQVDKDNNFTYSNIVVLKDENVDAAALPSIYPNPAKNMLNVKVVSSNTDNKLMLRVTDMLGRQLLNKITSVGAGESIIQVDVAHLPAGVYMLTLISGSGEITVKKFVKQE